jgi:hypothetical protein
MFSPPLQISVETVPVGYKPLYCTPEYWTWPLNGVAAARQPPAVVPYGIVVPSPLLVRQLPIVGLQTPDIQVVDVEPPVA